MAAAESFEEFPQGLVDQALKGVPGSGVPEDDSAESPFDEADDEESPFGEPGRDGDEGEGEGDGEADDGEGEEDEDAAELDADDRDEGDEDDGPKKKPVRGSKEKPLKLSDLSDKEFVQVKIDGVEETLSLKELASAGMRQRTFDKRAHELKKLSQQSEKLVEQSEAKVKRFQAGLTKTFESPAALKAFMLSHYPDTLDDLVLDHYKDLYQQHTDGSYAHNKRERALERKERLLKQRAEQEETRRREQQSQSVAAERRAILGPALKEATAQSGFASPSKQDVLDICDALDIQERRKGALLTREEATQVATRWLRANRPEGAEKAPRKPRHRSRPRASAPSEGRKGRKKSQSVERYDQFGNLNPDWLLG